MTYREIDDQRRLRSALRTAFLRAPELQPAAAFTDRLRDQLRRTTGQPHRTWMFSPRWLAFAAGLVLAAASCRC